MRRFLRRDYPNLLLVDLVCPRRALAETVARQHTERIGGKRRGRRRLSGDVPAQGTPNLSIEVWRLPGGRRQTCRERPVGRFSVERLHCRLHGRPHFRENCFTCPYARPERGSDITIADFWGLRPCSVPIRQRVSLLLVSTAKGQEWADAVREKAVMEEGPWRKPCAETGNYKDLQVGRKSVTLSWRNMPPLRSRLTRRTFAAIAAGCGCGKERGWLLRLSEVYRS